MISTFWRHLLFGSGSRQTVSHNSTAAHRLPSPAQLGDLELGHLVLGHFGLLTSMLPLQPPSLCRGSLSKFDQAVFTCQPGLHRSMKLGCHCMQRHQSGRVIMRQPCPMCRKWQLLTVQCDMQIIYTANEEVARGLYNPAYKLLQMLPGPRSRGQECIHKFHSIMQDLLQEVTCSHHRLVNAVATSISTPDPALLQSHNHMNFSHNTNRDMQPSVGFLKDKSLLSTILMSHNAPWEDGADIDLSTNSFDLTKQWCAAGDELHCMQAFALLVVCSGACVHQALMPQSDTPSACASTALLTSLP